MLNSRSAIPTNIGKIFPQIPVFYIFAFNHQYSYATFTKPQDNCKAKPKADNTAFLTNYLLNG